MQQPHLVVTAAGLAAIGVRQMQAETAFLHEMTPLNRLLVKTTNAFKQGKQHVASRVRRTKEHLLHVWPPNIYVASVTNHIF